MVAVVLWSSSSMISEERSVFGAMGYISGAAPRVGFYRPDSGHDIAMGF